MNYLVLYPGRFQPFCPHHEAVYKKLCDKFGSKHVLILTSDKTDPDRSPFNFDEKKQIINSYGIPDGKVIKVRSPYSPVEVTSKLSDNVSLIFVYGEKDAERLAYTKKDGTPGYFTKFESKEKLTEPGRLRGYVYVAPTVSITIPGYGQMSASSVRKAIKEGLPFSDIFPKLDKDTLELLEKRLGKKKMSETQGLKTKPANEPFKMDKDFYKKVYALYGLEYQDQEELDEAPKGKKKNEEERTISFYHGRMEEILPEDVTILFSEDKNSIFIKFPEKYRSSKFKKGIDKTADRKKEDEEDAKDRADDTFITGLSFKTPKDTLRSISTVKSAKTSIRSKIRSITPSMNRLPSTIKITKDPEKKSNLLKSLAILKKFYDELKAVVDQGTKADIEKKDQEKKEDGK